MEYWEERFSGSRLKGRLVLYRQSLAAKPDKSAQALIYLLEEMVDLIHLQRHTLEDRIVETFKNVQSSLEMYRSIDQDNRELIRNTIATNAALKLQLEEGKMKSKTEKKVKKVMKEFSEGKLHSGSKTGPKVTNPKQAVAIGYSEGRKAAKKKGKK